MKKEKEFIHKIMDAAKKEKVGTLATRIMMQFIPKGELREPPKKKEKPPYYGNKIMKAAFKGVIGITNKHGIVGQAIANMKRNRILAAKMKG